MGYNCGPLPSFTEFLLDLPIVADAAAGPEAWPAEGDLLEERAEVRTENAEAAEGEAEAFGGKVVEPHPGANGTIVAPEGEAAGGPRVLGPLAPQSVDAGRIRFSQSSVNGYSDKLESMTKDGWNGDPIDVVRMPDGHLTSIDNTRLLAAQRLQIQARVIVHGYDDPLPTTQYDRLTTKQGGVPATWGQAVLNRIGKQNAGFRAKGPFGTFDQPRANS